MRQKEEACRSGLTKIVICAEIFKVLSTVVILR